MSSRDANGVRLIFSVDVEEEGLFSGRYAARAEGLSNVAALSRLEFLPREHGLPPTLLCTWPVLADPSCAVLLRRWQDEFGAEIGAHLHPWNTPPLADETATSWLPSESMDPALLEAKLATLLAACREVSGRAPACFRMGRFDLGPKMRGLLSGHGLRVDSSLVPGRYPAGQFVAMPESFLCPSDPHPLVPALGGQPHVLEAPITMVPLLPGLPRLAWAAAGLLPESAGQGLLRSFRRYAMTGVQPVWFPLASMKLAARLHLARGGRVIHMFLHSSELSPGHAAHLPDEAAVERVLARIRAFLPWLHKLARPLGGLRPTSLSALSPTEARP